MARALDYDRERVLELIRLARADVGDTASEIGQSVGRELGRLAINGVAWAHDALVALASQSLVHIAAHEIKRDRATITFGWNGAVIKTDVPARLAMKSRDVNGAPTREKPRQYKLWKDMLWDEFLDMVNGLRRQRDRLDAEVLAFLRVVELRNQYPQSQTPDEACRLAGIDPADFNIASGI